MSDQTVGSKGASGAPGAAGASNGVPPPLGGNRSGKPPHPWGWPPDPAFITLYGELGLTKTTTLAAAFPTALFLCQPGGLLPSNSWLGLGPEYGTRPVRTKHVESLRALRALVPAAVRHCLPAVVVDDLSPIAAGELAIIEEDFGDTRNKFAIWRALKDEATETRDALRYAGLMVACNAHEQQPWVDEEHDNLLKDGGPRLPSRPGTDIFPSLSDLVLRVEEDPARPGRTRAARAVFTCRLRPRWHGKDRLSVAPLKGPANLRALLVRAGYVLPRPAGLAWQDDVMRRVQKRVSRDGDDPEAVAREALANLVRAKGWHVKHVRWAILDGLAMAELDRLAGLDAMMDDLFGDAPPEAREGQTGGGATGPNGSNGSGLVIDVDGVVDLDAAPTAPAELAAPPAAPAATAPAPAAPQSAREEVLEL